MHAVVRLGSARTGNLRDSGIDMLKVGIPKLSAAARIEQPHSRITLAVFFFSFSSTPPLTPHLFPCTPPPPPCCTTYVLPA